MLIICSSCLTSYRIDSASLGPAGRKVRCIRCKTAWHANGPKVRADVTDSNANVNAEYGASDVDTFTPTEHELAMPSLMLSKSGSGKTFGPFGHHRISAHWFSGTILTALCIVGLMRGAVSSKFTDETNLTSSSERIEAALRGSLASGSRIPGAPDKGDRLVSTREANLTRQIIHVPMVTRFGDDDPNGQFRQFIRITANMPLIVSDLSANKLPNNSQHPLVGLSPGKKGAAEAAAVELQRAAYVAPVTSIKLADSGEENSASYYGIRLTSNNVTLVPKSESQTTDVRLYQSLYEIARRNQIPDPIINELILVYSDSVDLQHKVQSGDIFEVIYASDDKKRFTDGSNGVLFMALTLNGNTKKFYRYQSTDDGVADYYDETGKSAQNLLVRKPIYKGTMRSGFGSRKHPLLGYTKMLTGVDWAAPLGTPVYASGSGVVEKLGWESGYGKLISIRHSNSYESVYGHLTAYASSVELGTFVRQGQVIGYVGSTGLSDGAHLHYEILLNGHFVDPMRVRLPRARVLEGPALARFERERENVDRILDYNPLRVASAR